MYTVIRQHNGSIVEAVVLDLTRSRIRLAAVGADDVVELRRCGADWLDQRNEPVQFGFLLRDGGGSESPEPLPARAPHGASFWRVLV
jgi:hypothetical protein